jgi:hypothetical protein|tara:strand:+ start:107 stop:439 length:333 start_codon:yes stop_codon:yes gene_type:complete
MNRREKFGLSAIVGLLMLSAYLAYNLLYEKQKNAVWREDEAFVRFAYAIEAAPASGQDLMKKNVFYPRVIRFPTEVCVQLNSNPGWTDGGNIYCFSSADRRRTRTFPARP